MKFLLVLAGLLFGMTVVQAVGLSSLQDRSRRTLVREKDAILGWERALGLADEWKEAALRYEASAKACIAQKPPVAP